MCKKNDYGRKAITALLAVLTALFALAVMSGSADASPTKEFADAATDGVFKLKINVGTGETNRFPPISKARRKFL